MEADEMTRTLNAWLAQLALAALISGAGLVGSASAQQSGLNITATPTNPAQTNSQATDADLESILIFGLRAGLPEEQAYLKRVAASAKSGQIPEDLVRSTFAWAREKPRYQTRYFERALSKRAHALGIRVPLLGARMPGQLVPNYGQ
jgi:hypothetical protein